QGEWNYLDRQLAARTQPGNQLVLANQNDQPARRPGHNFFADQRPAVALDQVQVGVHFVSSIDGQVQNPGLAQRHEGNPQPRGQPSCFFRGRDTANSQASLAQALPQSANKSLGGTAGP